MKNPFRSHLFLGTLFIGIFFLVPQLQAAKPIAKVTSFKGQFLIQSGTEMVPVRRVGQYLYTGDRVQTKNGQVQVTFNDGALIKVSPYSNTLIQEREEKSGFWAFKSRKPSAELRLLSANCGLKAVRPKGEIICRHRQPSAGYAVQTEILVLTMIKAI